MDYQSELRNFKPAHEFFVGVDSDGCVFDTMEVKQKEFFIPNALKYFDLFPVSSILRETWEFINLYSVHRGGNRYLSIIKVFDLLREREEVKSTGVILPDLTALKKWVSIETKPGIKSLKDHFSSTGNCELAKVIRWSDAVDRDIAEWLRKMPPFTNASDAIRLISCKADLVIVSQTPLEAIKREWEENNMLQYVSAIAGQEHGSKTIHIELAARGKYPDKKILMAGDAMGDLLAARQNNILFFPIIPGKESKSWERFIREGFENFISGKFEGAYQNSLINEFTNSLPERAPWQGEVNKQNL